MKMGKPYGSPWSSIEGGLISPTISRILKGMASRTFTLPLFPLGVFLFPGEKTGLHIFEPRYRQLVSELEEALADGRE